MPEPIKWILLLCGVICWVLSENLVDGKLLGCFNGTDRGVQRKLLQALRAHRRATPRTLGHAADSCRTFLSAHPGDRPPYELSHRALAPWRTRTVKKRDMLPPKYEEAECLCDGCIINGVENNSYNSVPVVQTRLFLKRVQCPSDPNKYSLECEYVKVTVACTCAVPRS